MDVILFIAPCRKATSLDDQRFALLKTASRVRGNDEHKTNPFLLVIPAKAGIQRLFGTNTKTLDDQRFALLKIASRVRGNDEPRTHAESSPCLKH